MPRPTRPLEPFDRIPVNRFLEYQLMGYADGQARIDMEPRACYAQEAGVVQGGLLTALADTVAAYALLSLVPADKTIVGIELKVNFLQPGRIDGEVLAASASVLKHGRTLSVVESEVRQGPALLLKGSFSFLQYARSPGDGGVPSGRQ